MFDTAPPLNVGSLWLSNRTSIARQSAKIGLVCPICGLRFERYASQARRSNVNYCGRGCAAEGKRTEVERNCDVCGKSMLVRPSNLQRKTTCSPECASAKKRSRGKTHRPGSLAAYRRAVEAVSERSLCSSCGKAHGPWVVRGVTTSTPVGEMPTADSTGAVLLCRQCHLKDVAKTGGLARQAGC